MWQEAEARRMLQRGKTEFYELKRLARVKVFTYQKATLIWDKLDHIKSKVLSRQIVLSCAQRKERDKIRAKAKRVLHPAGLVRKKLGVKNVFHAKNKGTHPHPTKQQFGAFWSDRQASLLREKGLKGKEREGKHVLKRLKQINTS